MNTRGNESGGGLVPASRNVAAVTDSSEMRDWAEQLVARARNEGIELTGDNGRASWVPRLVGMIEVDAVSPRFHAHPSHASAPWRCVDVLVL